MALSLFSGGRCNILWDPVWSESAWRPFELARRAPDRSDAQDAKAIAGVARVERWQEAARVVEAELPGLERGGMKVELEDDRNLSISGEREHDVEQKDDASSWDAVVRSQRKILWPFELPENAQDDSVTVRIGHQSRILKSSSIGVA